MAVLGDEFEAPAVEGDDADAAGEREEGVAAAAAAAGVSHDVECETESVNEKVDVM